jgi:hypothetical protein
MILSKPQLVENIVREISDNSTSQISPYDIRHNLLDIIDSVHLLTGSQNLKAKNFDTPDTRSTKVGNFALDKLGLDGYFSVDNTAIGYYALNANYQGVHNTAIGSNALSCNIYGEDNAALGYHSLAGNTNGFGNVGIGSFALHNNRIGNFNIAIGHGAGYYVDRDTNNRLFIASHPIDETFLCGNPEGLGLVPLIQGDMSSGNLRVGIAVSGLHEGATLQISGNFHPSDSLKTFDIGHSTYRWRSIYLSRSIYFTNDDYITYDDTNNKFLISNDIVVAGPASIGGSATISGNLLATGHANIGSYANINGDLVVSGDASVSGHLTPRVHKLFDLGELDRQWLNTYTGNIYVSGIGRFKRFEAVEQSHYLHKTINLASSGYLNVIDGGGPNGLYDYYTPNEETVIPSGYLLDEELNGAGFNARSRGIDYERTYEFIFRSQDSLLNNLSIDNIYSRSSWRSNISISTSAGCHVETDRVLNNSSIGLLTYDDGLGYYVISGKLYCANQHNISRNLLSASDVNFIANSGETDQYTISYVSPNSGVNINQRFLSNTSGITIDEDNNKENLTGFELSYVADSTLEAPMFFNEQVGQNPSRFLVKSFNNSSYAKRSFTLLQDASDGYVGISNFAYADNMLPDTILNIRSTGNAIIRATAENNDNTVSALQLLGKENCLKYGVEFEYSISGNLFNINTYNNENKQTALKISNSGNKIGIFSSGIPHSMLMVGSSGNSEAVVSLYHSSGIPSGHAGYAKIFTKSQNDEAKSSSLNFLDSSGNLFEVVMNSVDLNGQNIDKPLLADDNGNTFGGRLSPNTKSALSTCIRNTTLGYRALSYVNGGNNNTVVGYAAGSGTTTGNNNVILGSNSAQSLTTGSNNIIIGYNLANTYTGGTSNIFMLGSDSNVLMSGNILTKNTFLPEGKLSLINNSNESLKLQANTIEVVDGGGSNYPDVSLSFKFTGNSTAELFKLDHTANPISKSVTYTSPATARPYGELKGDLRLLGALRFSDGSKAVESGSFLDDITRLSNSGVAISGALSNTTAANTTLRNDFDSLIIEGFAQENISAPPNASTAATGRIRQKVKVGNSWQDKTVPPGQDPYTTIYNRDPFLRINKNDYVVAIRVNGEYRPMWVSYYS